MHLFIDDLNWLYQWLAGYIDEALKISLFLGSLNKGQNVFSKDSNI